MSDDDKPSEPAAEKARRRWKAKPAAAVPTPVAPASASPGWSPMLTDIVATAMARAGIGRGEPADDDVEGDDDDGDKST